MRANEKSAPEPLVRSSRRGDYLYRKGGPEWVVSCGRWLSRRLPFSPCHIEGFSEEVLCGTHRVFEDRAAQSGRTIDLKVAVVPALRREAADDPLFVLAGGPGQGATKYGPLIPLAFREVRKTRDIVLVDLRGTGGSNPLGCDLGDPLEILEGDLDATPCLGA